jgi:hypothetical protein
MTPIRISIERALALIGMNVDVLRLWPVEAIAKGLRVVPASTRKRMASQVDSLLQDAAVRRNEDVRVALVKLLAALPQYGVAMMLAWIAKRQGRDVYEVHFTCFCFLDDAWKLAEDDIRASIVNAVRDYLATIDVETARAAWMAGDLLGDHLELGVALPILLDLAGNARYVAGRLAALHGLGHALARCTSKDKSRIVRIAAERRRFDRSAHVRRAAVRVMNGQAC